MGLLDGILGAVSGTQGQAGQTNDPKAMLIKAALSMLTSQSGAGASGAEGGLSGLLGKFQAAGMGDAVNSWLSNGPNHAVSPDQVQQALGGGQLEHLAQATGLTESETANHLSEMLPGLIDKLTPNGQIPEAGGGLAKLQGLLGGFLGGNKPT